jgi:hypothetical protein
MNLGDMGRGFDRICLTQARDKWRALVNEVMNLGFHKVLRASQVAAQLVASRVMFSFQYLE